MYPLCDLRGHRHGYNHIMVLSKLPAAANVTVRALVLRNASPSGCVLGFQGRVSLVVWGPILKLKFRWRRNHNGASIRHIRFPLAPSSTTCLHGLVALYTRGGAHIVGSHSHSKQ